MFSSLKVLVRFHVRVISRHSYSRLVADRNYSRWAHRRPVRVIQPEDNENGKFKIRCQEPLERNKNSEHPQNASGHEVDLTSTSHLDESDNIGSRISAYEKQIENVSHSKRTNKITQSQGGKERTAKKPTSDCEIPAYTKLNENDTMFGNLMTSVKSKKQREKKGLILLEGRRLIADAVAAGVVPSYVFFSQASSVAGLGLSASGSHLYKIAYKTITLWSDVTTSQGIVAICKLPAPEELAPPEEGLPLTVVCDNVREPGNLGAILRTAVGAGSQRVLLTKGCMDPWDPKVLRSGVGAHFRMRIQADVSWEDVPEMLGESLVCLADSTGCPGTDDGAEGTETAGLPVVPYYGVDYPAQTSVALVIGGETEGLSSSAYQLAASRQGVRVHIPLSNGLESLNTGTALGVILFEMKRQFLTADHHQYYQDSSLAVKSF